MVIRHAFLAPYTLYPAPDILQSRVWFGVSGCGVYAVDCLRVEKIIHVWKHFSTTRNRKWKPQRHTLAQARQWCSSPRTWTAPPPRTPTAKSPLFRCSDAQTLLNPQPCTQTLLTPQPCSKPYLFLNLLPVSPEPYFILNPTPMRPEPWFRETAWLPRSEPPHPQNLQGYLSQCQRALNPEP